MTVSDHELSVAVAMATYNGERFLQQQLDSLARQTHLPHELVVCDDCSHDRTVEVVQDFARVAPFPVRVFRAASRRGHVSGFLEAASLCRGDLVAFCDQDDIWRHEKLARCVAEFELRRDVTLVVHSGLVVGKHARGTPRSYPAYRRRRITGPAASPVILKAPGFAIVASRRLLEAWDVVGEPPVSAFGVGWWGHDTWTSFIATALGAVVFLPDRLVLYRQHDANVCGAPASGVANRVEGSVACRGEEDATYRSTAEWARDRVRLLEELDRRVKQLPGGFMRGGPRVRARLWARVAAVHERRAVLYAAEGSGHSSLRALMGHAVRGDYGRQRRGGLGLASLGRDTLHVMGVLNLVASLAEPSARSSR